MTILVDEFKIQVGEYGFDLYKVVKGKRVGDGTLAKPTGEEYEREDSIGYYTDLGNVIKKIMLLRLSEKKSVVGLKEFCTEYKKEVDRLEEIIGRSTSNKS